MSRTRTELLNAVKAAVERGDAAILRSLIADGYPVNCADRDSGLYPVHEAARRGHIQCLELLLNADPAAVNCRTKQGATPLHFAVHASRFALETTQYLLSNGAEISATAKSGCTPFHVAFKHGNIEVVRYLLIKYTFRHDIIYGKALAPDTSAELGKLAFHFIAEKDDSGRVLKELLAFEERVGVSMTARNAHSVACYAAKWGNAKFLVVFLEKYKVPVMRLSDRCFAGESLVANAIKCGDTSIAAYLVEEGASVITRARNGVISWGAMLSVTCAGEAFNQIFEILVQNIDRHHVIEYNQSAAAVSSGNPLMSALAHRVHATDSHKIESLLQLGFDPNRMLFEDRHFPASGSLFDVFCRDIERNLSEPYRACGVVSFILVSRRRRSYMLDLLKLFVSHGADVNCRLLPPLVALTVVSQLNTTADTPFPFDNALAYLLDNGADLNFRSGRYVDTRCSDVALTAAYVGNARMITHLVAETGLDPKALLRDLVSFRRSSRKSNNYNRQRMTDQAMHFADSIAALLPFTTHQSVVGDICRQIGRNLLSVFSNRCGRCGGWIGDGVLADSENNSLLPSTSSAHSEAMVPIDEDDDDVMIIYDSSDSGGNGIAERFEISDSDSNDSDDSDSSIKLIYLTQGVVGMVEQHGDGGEENNIGDGGEEEYVGDFGGDAMIGDGDYVVGNGGGDIEPVLGPPSAIVTKCRGCENWNEILARFSTGNVDTLQHMCRVAVRERLVPPGRGCDLAAAVAQLPLPTILKDYVLFKKQLKK